MSNTLSFEMTLEAKGEVARACCGRDHEFGPCPYQKNEEAA